MMRMKKLIVTVAAFFGIVLGLNAQQAFKSLAIGFEAGTTGLGVEVAVPIVTNRIVLKGGLTSPSFTYPYSFSGDMQPVNDEIIRANDYLMQSGLDDRINTRFSDLSLSASSTLNLSSARLLLEFYPFKSSSFHITAGAYMGMGDKFLSATVRTDKTFMTELNAMKAEINAINSKYADVPGYSPVDVTADSFNMFDSTYKIREEDGRAVFDADFKVAKVRPYLGLGFGRSMPKKHLGFQFDLGLWYHGKVSLSSANQVDFNPDAPDLTPKMPGLEKDKVEKMLMFYPHVAFRLIYKIF